MGQTHSNNKKIPRVSQYCKEKYGSTTYYDTNACRKNGKLVAKITLNKFQKISSEPHSIKTKTVNANKKNTKKYKKSRKNKKVF